MYRLGYDAFRFEERDKPLFKIDPRAKLATSTYLIILAILMDGIYGLAIYLSSLAVYISVLGGIASKIARNIAVLTPLLVIIFLANYIVTYDPVRSILPALKFIALIMSLNLFFLTTSPDEFSLTLERMGIPLSITLAFSLSLRFIGLLARQLMDIVEMQMSRGVRLDTGGIMTRIRNYITILIPLIVLSIKRSIEIAEALELRGYRPGARHTPYKELRITYRDIIFIVGTATIFTLIYYVSSLTPPYNIL